MAERTTNSFTTYQLTDQETLSCSVLSFGQEQLIQNDMAAAAQQLVNMDAPTPETLHDFTRNWAFLQSQVRTYQQLLDRSNAAKQTLANLAALASTGKTSQ